MILFWLEAAKLKIMSNTLIQPERVLTEIEQFTATQLDWLLPRVVALRAALKGGALPADEARLLTDIQQTIPPDLTQRYQSLIALREQATLTETQAQELATLTQAYERLTVVRLQRIAELAELRRSTPSVVVRQFGLTLPAHV